MLFPIGQDSGILKSRRKSEVTDCYQAFFARSHVLLRGDRGVYRKSGRPRHSVAVGGPNASE